jgi:nucleoid-associated protein YgaU
MINEIKIQPFTSKKYYKNNIYPPIPFDESDIYIITRVGDRLDLISFNYYGSTEYWKIIAAINNNITKGSLFPTPGTQLRIPQNINKILKIIEDAN